MARAFAPPGLRWLRGHGTFDLVRSRHCSTIRITSPDMFFYGGTRRTEKSLGYVADFCCNCRAPRACRISRVGMADHAYGISLGSQGVTGHTATCDACGHAFDVNAMMYAGFAPRQGHDIEELARETFPNLGYVHGHRLLQEQQLLSGQLSAADREMFFNEIFQRFALAAEKSIGGGIQIRGRGGWGCFGTFLLAGIVFLTGSLMMTLPEQRAQILWIAAGILVVGGIYSIIQLALEPGRLFREKLVPSFADALKRLKPHKEEVAYCLDKMKGLGFKLGKKLDTETLWNAITEERLTEWQG